VGWLVGGVGDWVGGREGCGGSPYSLYVHGCDRDNIIIIHFVPSCHCIFGHFVFLLFRFRSSNVLFLSNHMKNASKISFVRGKVVMWVNTIIPRSSTKVYTVI
jgi:hypothetical protein